MEELIRKHLANNFADFAGLEITGSVPVKQELINEVIATFLAAMTKDTAPAPANLEENRQSGNGDTPATSLPEPVQETVTTAPISESVVAASELEDVAPSAAPVEESFTALTPEPVVATAPAEPAPAAPKRPSLNIRELLKMVTKVEVKAADGKLTVHFAIRR